MANRDERMQMISSAILAQAKQESEDIIEKANQTREQELLSYKDQVIDSMYDTLQRAVSTSKHDTTKKIAQFERDFYRDILLKREEYRLSIFNAVRGRLEQHATTEDYHADLIRSLKELAAANSQIDHTKSVVRMREADLNFEAEVKSILGDGVTVEQDRTIKLGGFTLKNTAAGLYFDETMDTRLENQVSWFLTTCKLQVK